MKKKSSSRRSSLKIGFLLLVLLSNACGRKSTGDSRVDTTVNGQLISNQQFQTSLQLYAGPMVMSRLMEHQLIFQEAEKRHIKLSEDDVKEPMSLLRAQEKSALRLAAMEEELRARLLTKAILLSDVSEAERRDIYETFKVELARVELSMIVLPDRDVAKQVQIALETGTPFDVLAASSSTDPASKVNGGKVGRVTWLFLKDRFGRDAADAVFRLREGQATPPLPLQDGRLGIFAVKKRYESYEDLKGAVEDMLVEAGRHDLSYRLFCEADIRSPYLPRRQSNVAPPSTPRAVAAPPDDKTPIPRPSEAPPEALEPPADPLPIPLPGDPGR